MKRLIIALSVLAVVAAAVVTVVVIVRARGARLASPTVTSPASQTKDATKPAASAPVSTAPQGILPREQDAPQALSTSAQGDADSDGLTDGEERERGTNTNRKDTDGDGLSDLDEVRSYCTDPLKASTDGKTQDAVWVETHVKEASAAGQRPSFCVH